MTNKFLSSKLLRMMSINEFEIETKVIRLLLKTIFNMKVDVFTLCLIENKI